MKSALALTIIALFTSCSLPIRDNKNSNSIVLLDTIQVIDLSTKFINPYNSNQLLFDKSITFKIGFNGELGKETYYEIGTVSNDVYIGATTPHCNCDTMHYIKVSTSIERLWDYLLNIYAIEEVKSIVFDSNPVTIYLNNSKWDHTKYLFLPDLDSQFNFIAIKRAILEYHDEWINLLPDSHSKNLLVGARK